MYKFLNDQQREELLLSFKLEKYKKGADRIRVILLLDENWIYKDICKAFLIDDSTIRHWRKRYIEGGIDRLVNDNWKYKKTALSPNQLKELTKHLEENTYRRAKDVVKHVQGKYKIKYRPNTMVKIMRSLGFSYKKSKKQPSKASIEAQKSFITAYRGFKSRGKVYFVDSTHPKFCPVMSYGWIKKGFDKFISTNAGRIHLNITGAVNIETADVITRQSATVNEDAIIDILRAVKSKNPDEKNLYLIFDNARYNKSKKVKAEARRLKVRLKYVPPYSPNLNLIERLWRFFRDRILGMKRYSSLDEFSKICSNFFRGIRKYKDELKTLLIDNFQLLKTGKA